MAEQQSTSGLTNTSSCKIQTRTAVYLVLELLLFTSNLLLMVKFNNDRTAITECDETFRALINRQPGRKLIMRIISKHSLEEHDIFVKDAFQAMGYTGGILNGDNKRYWDVMYTSFDPFSPAYIKDTIEQMSSSHQKINHIAGIGHLIDPVEFFHESKRLPFALQAYVVPDHTEALAENVANNPDKVWLETDRTLRHAKVVKSQDLELSKESSKGKGDRIVQEFIRNPFLVDNRKFIISAFIVVTSVEPLRVYVYDDLLIRYASEDLYSFGLDERDGLTIDDTNKAYLWQMESMKKFGHRRNGVYKQRRMLEEFIRATTGKDPEFLRGEIHSAVEQVFRNSEEHFHTQLYAKLKTAAVNNVLFETMRWDFVMDDAMNLFLQKTSISPAMTVNSSENDPSGFSLIQQMYYSMIHVVGMPVNYISKDTPRLSADRSRLRSGDVFVYQDMCYTDQCISCERGCEMCPKCLSYEDKEMLKSNYREHLDRQQFRRVAPSAKTRPWNTSNDIKKDVFASKLRVLQTNWLKLKCSSDAYWCF